jgi:hypothetical protein
MKSRSFLPIVAVLFAALTLPTEVFAQSTNVRPPNKNLSAKFRSIIVKGSGNLIGSNSLASFIGGGQSNSIYARFTNGMIGGGFGNVISNHFVTVGGGLGNTASGERATVGGGFANTASGGNATVSGGEGNLASDGYAVIGGGVNNKADGPGAAVAGGQRNAASGYMASIGGGEYNTASGDYATVPGGNSAMATNNGAFVWNGVDGVVTASTNDNSFTVRAPGGVRFITTTATSGLEILSLPVVGVNGVALGPGGTAWKTLSDSNAKTAVVAVDPRAVLEKLDRLPVTEWEYKHDPHRRYYGPMAQDFHAAFGLGNDDKTINTLDADGVLFLSIKGLVEELKDRDAKIGELKAKMEAMEERLNSLPPAP